MDRESLKALLGQGLSVERIAERFGKDPSTVSYWMGKYGLQAADRATYGVQRGIEREELEVLVEGGASVTFIAESLRRSPSTVRRWLSRYGLQTGSTVRRRTAQRAREGGRLTVELNCRHHGPTSFVIEGRGVYRCRRCRQEAVVRRRRKVKETLVEEAGGACSICGYDRYLGGLHFHHRERSEKSFSLSVDGVARSLERARAEARKCVLLCSNCHAEVEAGLVSIPLQSRSSDPG